MEGHHLTERLTAGLRQEPLGILSVREYWVTWSGWLRTAVRPEELSDGENPERNDEREENNLRVGRVLVLRLLSGTLSQVTIAATHSSLRELPANLREL